ncbi:hypothetical protein TL16_g04813, partial [Triparma laevis f. inornata]
LLTPPHPAQSQILRHLSSSPSASLNTYTFSQSLPSEYGVTHSAVLGCAKSLAADSYVTTSSNKISYFQLTSEGTTIAKEGSQEAKCWNAIKAAGEAGLDKKALEAAVGSSVAKVGMGNCMKAKWISKNGDALVSTVSSITDTVQTHLNLVLSADEDTNGSVLPAKEFTLLKKRKLVKAVDRTSYDITRGPAYKLERKKKAADFTKEMLDSGAWETTEFKPYNFATVGEKVGGGYLHPLLKVRAEFRKILMQMGFSEMPTNKWVESSFWNFDTLFQPQSHPARDAHDTFFIKDPAQTVSVPEEYYKRVVKMHEEGGSGSIGYRYNFKEGDARKNLLRTHTTAVSSQMLYKLANQPGGFTPKRYFSIDRVFRNESMDATHLCEFHQVEGLVADYDLSLGDLIGTIETFFKKVRSSEAREDAHADFFTDAFV